HQLISDESENYPLVSKNIPGMLYMDDLVASFLTENECVLFYREITELFKSGGFTFTKWSSNSAQVLHNIPASDQLEKMISWDKDNFTLKVLVILFVKLLIKRLWIAKIDWDSQPPPDILSLWNLFIQQLPSLENISFPRHINVKINCIFQLVGFADASEKAYGAVIYSRVILPDSTVKVELICAKSKVAPVKVESIPRLELCGLLLLSELMATVTKSYLSKFEIDESYCLTDSSVTLCWAHSSPHLYQVFIANRISKIQQNINISTLFHVSGQDNPADCLSRGLVPEQLVDCNLYLSGPPWLHQSPVEWPIRKYSDFAGQETPERKSNLSLIGVQDEPNPLLEMFLRCSSWYKILKIVILILRFLKIIPKGLAVSAEALNTAEIFVMKLLQKEFFPHDISNIRKGLPCSPQIRKLSPFLDDHGLLRVGGRISNSNVDYDQQHPILLSSKHHVVVLIVDYFHQKNYHTGPHLLLALLRQRFWILGARSLARKRFQACNICFRLSPKCSYPKMGDLPKSRVLESKPFLNTACDYLGPIHIVLTHRRGQRSQKAYICLFICLATKAVHLEVASDLTTECFLNAFKRFLSRRGPIRSMLSDGGSNFVGAKNKLNVIYDLLESPDYKDRFVRELSEHRITWSMNPPASPHFGGIFENDEFMEPGPIFGILGSSVYPYILLGDTVHGSVDQPVAVSTKLGHVIFGNAPMLSTSVDNQSHCMFQSSLDTDLVRFWEIENVPSVEGFKLSPEDKLCEEIYSSEVSRNDDGLYQVPLPFKEDPTQLGDSFTMAKKRFFLLEKRLQSSEDLRSSYDQAMSDLIDKGFMSKCSDQSDISGYFIPHHIVTKSESVSTKVRVVYDAS
ncbi:uncharacterized protein LOC103521222, partial [Diaphorina citri]|uniref:Uncharacterized protein LOC103521222 n=1 Tax=Diaphorina citri TaxID=121845 RepID=A0A1S3DMG2_DIACI